MKNIKEIALFTSHSIGFYPDKLKSIVKQSSFIEMRAHIFPDYIKKQKSIEGTSVEMQKMYDKLGVGESFRVGNRFYNAEMIPVMRFTTGDTYIPTSNTTKEEFDHMKLGDVIKFRNKEFRKDKDDEFIYVYELMISTCELVNVDIDRLWTIDEYDGSEGITYLDYDVIDDKLNYCEMKGE